MGYDKDKVDEMLLALLYLTMFEEKPAGERGKDTTGTHSTDCMPKAISLTRRARRSRW